MVLELQDTTATVPGGSRKFICCILYNNMSRLIVSIVFDKCKNIAGVLLLLSTVNNLQQLFLYQKAQ